MIVVDKSIPYEILPFDSLTITSKNDFIDTPIGYIARDSSKPDRYLVIDYLIMLLIAMFLYI